MSTWRQALFGRWALVAVLLTMALLGAPSIGHCSVYGYLGVNIKVVDPNNVPLSSATVNIWETSEYSYSGETAMTDARGIAYVVVKLDYSVNDLDNPQPNLYVTGSADQNDPVRKNLGIPISYYSSPVKIRGWYVGGTPAEPVLLNGGTPVTVVFRPLWGRIRVPIKVTGNLGDVASAEYQLARYNDVYYSRHSTLTNASGEAYLEQEFSYSYPNPENGQVGNYSNDLAIFVRPLEDTAHFDHGFVTDAIKGIVASTAETVELDTRDYTLTKGKKLDFFAIDAETGTTLDPVHGGGLRDITFTNEPYENYTADMLRYFYDPGFAATATYYFPTNLTGNVSGSGDGMDASYTCPIYYLGSATQFVADADKEIKIPLIRKDKGWLKGVVRTGGPATFTLNISSRQNWPDSYYYYYNYSRYYWNYQIASVPATFDLIYLPLEPTATYAVRIDVAGKAPHYIPEIVIPAPGAAVDLGNIVPLEGQKIAAKIRTQPGDMIPPAEYNRMAYLWRKLANGVWFQPASDFGGQVSSLWASGTGEIQFFGEIATATGGNGYNLAFEPGAYEMSRLGSYYYYNHPTPENRHEIIDGYIDYVTTPNLPRSYFEATYEPFIVVNGTDPDLTYFCKRAGGLNGVAKTAAGQPLPKIQQGQVAPTIFSTFKLNASDTYYPQLLEVATYSEVTGKFFVPFIRPRTRLVGRLDFEAGVGTKPTPTVEFPSMVTPGYSDGYIRLGSTTVELTGPEIDANYDASTTIFFSRSYFNESRPGRFEKREFVASGSKLILGYKPDTTPEGKVVLFDTPIGQTASATDANSLLMGDLAFVFENVPATYTNGLANDLPVYSEGSLTTLSWYSYLKPVKDASGVPQLPLTYTLDPYYLTYYPYLASQTLANIATLTFSSPLPGGTILKVKKLSNGQILATGSPVPELIEDAVAIAYRSMTFSKPLAVGTEIRVYEDYTTYVTSYTTNVGTYTTYDYFDIPTFHHDLRGKAIAGGAICQHYLMPNEVPVMGTFGDASNAYTLDTLGFASNPLTIDPRRFILMNGSAYIATISAETLAKEGRVYFGRMMYASGRPMLNWYVSGDSPYPSSEMLAYGFFVGQSQGLRGESTPPQYEFPVERGSDYVLFCQEKPTAANWYSIKDGYRYTMATFTVDATVVDNPWTKDLVADPGAILAGRILVNGVPRDVGNLRFYATDQSYFGYYYYNYNDLYYWNYGWINTEFNSAWRKDELATPSAYFYKISGLSAPATWTLFIDLNNKKVLEHPYEANYPIAQTEPIWVRQVYMGKPGQVRNFDFDLSFKSVGYLLGKVVDDTGVAIPNATMFVRKKDIASSYYYYNYSLPVFTFKTVGKGTGSDTSKIGQYFKPTASYPELIPLEAGDYELYLASTGSQLPFSFEHPAERTFTVLPGTKKTFDYVLHRIYGASGTLTIDGHPATDTYVELRNNQTGDSYSSYTDWYGSGTYAFSRVDPGSYTMIVRNRTADGMSSQIFTKKVLMPRGQAMTLDVAFNSKDLAEIEVRMLDNKKNPYYYGAFDVNLQLDETLWGPSVYMGSYHGQQPPVIPASGSFTGNETGTNTGTGTGINSSRRFEVLIASGTASATYHIVKLRLPAGVYRINPYDISYNYEYGTPEPMLITVVGSESKVLELFWREPVTFAVTVNPATNLGDYQAWLLDVPEFGNGYSSITTPTIAYSKKRSSYVISRNQGTLLNGKFVFKNVNAAQGSKKILYLMTNNYNKPELRYVSNVFEINPDSPTMAIDLPALHKLTVNLRDQVNPKQFVPGYVQIRFSVDPDKTGGLPLETAAQFGIGMDYTETGMITGTGTGIETGTGTGTGQSTGTFTGTGTGTGNGTGSSVRSEPVSASSRMMSITLPITIDKEGQASVTFQLPTRTYQIKYLGNMGNSAWPYQQMVMEDVVLGASDTERTLVVERLHGVGGSFGPVPNGFIQFMSENEYDGINWNGGTYAADGQYFAFLQPGTYFGFARPEKDYLSTGTQEVLYAPTMFGPFEISRASDTVYPIRMKPGVRISGKVTIKTTINDPDTQVATAAVLPVANAYINVYRRMTPRMVDEKGFNWSGLIYYNARDLQNEGYYAYSVYSDSNGNFNMLVEPNVDYYIFPNSRYGMSFMDPVKVSMGTTDKTDVLLQYAANTGELAGKVTGTTLPVDIMAEWYGASDGMNSGSVPARSDSEGNFKLTGLVKYGQYKLTFKPTDMSLAQIVYGPVAIDGSGTLSVAMETGHDVFGTLTDIASDPITDATYTVYLSWNSGELWQTLSTYSNSQTGAFVFHQVPQREHMSLWVSTTQYVNGAMVSPYAQETKELIFGADGKVDNQVIVLKKAGKVRFRLVDEQGLTIRNIGDAGIFLQGQSNNYTGRIASDGFFNIVGVPAGVDYTLIVAGVPGRELYRKPGIQVLEEEITDLGNISLGAGSKITGVIANFGESFAKLFPSANTQGSQLSVFTFGPDQIRNDRDFLGNEAFGKVSGFADLSWTGSTPASLTYVCPTQPGINNVGFVVQRDNTGFGFGKSQLFTGFLPDVATQAPDVSWPTEFGSIIGTAARQTASGAGFIMKGFGPDDAVIVFIGTPTRTLGPLPQAVAWPQNGKWKIERLPAGMYRAVMFCRDFPSRETTVTIAKGTETKVASDAFIINEIPARLVGKVVTVASGSVVVPVPDAKVQMGRDLVTMTNASGTYEFYVPQGIATFVTNLFISKPGFESTKMLVVLPNLLGTSSFDLGVATLSTNVAKFFRGTVYGKNGTETVALANAKVNLAFRLPAPVFVGSGTSVIGSMTVGMPEVPGTLIPFGTVITDSTGNYSFSSVPASRPLVLNVAAIDYIATSVDDIAPMLIGEDRVRDVTLNPVSVDTVDARFLEADLKQDGRIKAQVQFNMRVASPSVSVEIYLGGDTADQVTPTLGFLDQSNGKLTKFSIEAQGVASKSVTIVVKLDGNEVARRMIANLNVKIKEVEVNPLSENGFESGMTDASGTQECGIQIDAGGLPPDVKDFKLIKEVATETPKLSDGDSVSNGSFDGPTYDFDFGKPLGDTTSTNFLFMITLKYNSTDTSTLEPRYYNEEKGMWSKVGIIDPQWDSPSKGFVSFKVTHLTKFAIVNTAGVSGLRCDIDGNGKVNLTDAVFILGWINSGRSTDKIMIKNEALLLYPVTTNVVNVPTTIEDLDGNGKINLTDVVFMLGWINSGRSSTFATIQNEAKLLYPVTTSLKVLPGAAVTR
ncbi:MAG: hypothetical protein WA705_28145 [Candidatus Ozemobacteraceae bacterium]